MAKPKSTAVVKAKSVSVPANIDELFKKEIEELHKRLSAPGGDNIQVTQKKTFKLPDGTETQGPLDLVIVDFINANYFYTSRYDPNDVTPPACFAINRILGDLAPSPNAPEPQAEKCSECPQNQFGSAQDGRGKACRNMRLLAVLPPDADEESALAVLKVSPTAIRAFDAYVATISRQFQAPVLKVVTEVSFDPNLDFPSLRFGNPRPNPNWQLAWSRREEARVRLEVEPDVSGYEKPQPKKVVARGRRTA